MDSKEQAMFNAAYAAYYDAAPMRAERFVGSLREEKKSLAWPSELTSKWGSMWNTRFSATAHWESHQC